MRRTSRLLVLFGIGLAVLTFVVILALFQPGGNTGKPQVTTPPDVQVVIAVQDIGIGTAITLAMLDTRKVPPTGKSAGALADPSQAVGQVVRRPIAAGGQVTAGAFQADSGAAAALVVPAGFRAVAISVDELTGVGNLVQAGDTVDIIISLGGDAFPVVQVNADGSIEVVQGLNPLSVKAPLLVQDVLVLATIDAPVAAAEGTTPAASAPPTLTGQKKLVILAVTPAQAEVLLFARTTGRLDLVLRSPEDEGQTATTDGVILKTLIDKYGVLPPQLIQAILPR